MKLLKILVLSALAVLLFSCATGPVNVPLDMPPAKIIQKAQEAADINKYKIALQYYQILRERYSDEEEYLCTADYEIAFIRYKQRKYTEARLGFELLLSRYKQNDGQSLPPQFKVLAEKVLARISERGF
jgi:outer membrane protein assembly factor BamD (BamD/ComL family)